MAALTSFMWSFFEPDSADDTYATCLLYKSRIKRRKDKRTFSSLPLIKHVEARHKELFLKEKEAAAEAKAKVQQEAEECIPHKKQKLSAVCNGQCTS